MNQIFLLQNHENLFLSRQREWVDGRELSSLFKTPHKDEALNQLVEVNAKDVSQRIRIVTCGLKANGLPDIDPTDLTPPSTSVADPENITIKSDDDHNDETPSAATENPVDSAEL